MEYKKTPLYKEHLRLEGNMVSFGGYILPTHYKGINYEHEIVRSKAGLFDVSHMGEFIISGFDSEEFMQEVTVSDVSQLKIGQAQYSVMCNENGGIVDDILIYKKENEFMLVVNAANHDKDLKWLRSKAKGNVSIKDISEATGLIAIQGPRSRDILQMLTDFNLVNIQFYRFVIGKIAGKETVISRTGYTGELGYEIYSSSDDIKVIWHSLINAGADHGIEPVGLGCRDTLRMEMKFSLYGNDINENTNPLEAGLGWVTKLSKKNFIGKKALLEAKNNISKRLVCIEMIDKAIPRSGYQIFLNDEVIGTITSGTMSPSIEKGIAIGYVNIPFTDSGTELLIDIRGKKKAAKIVKPPFYSKGSLMD